jgi:hypothetical protein
MVCVHLLSSCCSHVDSALARFLLRRALTKQRLIGHIYYWQLQSEVYNQDVSKRYVILLQVGRPFAFSLNKYGVQFTSPCAPSTCNFAVLHCSFLLILLRAFLKF